MDFLTVMIIVALLSICGLYVFYLLLLMALSSFRKERNTVLKDFTPKVSIIIATYNEENVIAKKLSSLLKTSYPRDLYEIIVVDSGSTDNTREIVRDFESKGVILLEQKTRLGKANALNLALKETKGEIIVMTDANSEFQASDLNKFIQSFDEQTGAVLPRFIPDGPVSAWDKIFYEIHHIYKLLESKTDSVFIVFGELFAFRKNLINSVDERTAADDLDIAIMVRKENFKIKYVPYVTVSEKIPDNPKEVRTQKVRHIFGILQVMVKNIRLFGNPKYGYYGQLIFPAHFIQMTLGPFLVFSIIALAVAKLSEILISTLNPFLFATLISICVFVSVAFLLSRRFRAIGVSIYGFLSIQYYIILALLNFARGKDKHVWEKISSTREKTQS